MNQLFQEVLEEQVKPATGCTEPVAIALAAAKAASLLKGDVRSLKIVASRGLYKNASGVGIPGTRERGIAMAAFLGVTIAQPERGMRILEAATEEQKERARELVSRGILETGYTDSDYDVFVSARLVTDDGVAEAVIAGNHDRFIRVTRNQEVLLDAAAQPEQAGRGLSEMRDVLVRDVVDYAETVAVDDIEWLMDCVLYNRAVAEEGLASEYALGIGRGLVKLVDKGILSDSLLSRMRILVSAASDARMGGASLPVMTSCGSGNQGILIALPLSEYCDHHGLGREALLRALVVAHLTNAMAKAYLGKLSPLCGCSVSAGLGVSAGLTWLAGGTVRQIEGAIKGMLANLTGTLCDGAKGTCSLKLETAAVEAYTYAMLAREGVFLQEDQGIVEASCEASIANLERIGKQGMAAMDQTVLDMLDERTN